MKHKPRQYVAIFFVFPIVLLSAVACFIWAQAKLGKLLCDEVEKWLWD